MLSWLWLYLPAPFYFLAGGFMADLLPFSTILFLRHINRSHFSLTLLSF
jgi:hypothetical protein